MKIPLLFSFLVAHSLLRGQFTLVTEPGVQPHFLQTYSPLKFEWAPNASRSKSLALHIKNTWAISNVNTVNIRFVHDHAHWRKGGQVSAFLHPGCQDYQWHGHAATKVGAYSSLGLQLGVRYTTWLNGLHFFKPMATIHYGICKKSFFFECNTQLTKGGYARKLNPISPSWHSMLSVHITSEVCALGTLLITDQGIQNAQIGVLWKCRKDWMISCSTFYPTWGWSIGITQILRNRQQGWGYQQSAWVRPNMEYWIRFSDL